MTLDAVYSKWLSIQPLTEAERTLLSMRFTVEYNYNSSECHNQNSEKTSITI